jgi:hypothetical protein
VIIVTALAGHVRASCPCLRDGPHHQLETPMKNPDDAGFENRELSIEELDVIAGGGVWGWIKHEAASAANWVGKQWGKGIEALAGLGGGGHINITIHRQN